ncbi:PH domain-containing protein [Streptomyces iconiensis]|uniref:PH domain-containing protein n=1 Tax=Streptomyces iconiensis TaxID=1384038 RepID=A0ABT6ZTK3_9ACTN|nr:PH domain-containing protein [Streptomyces iconiensis]MDJ1131966.1 PH domain-containing protein [Streptomyces iconiensis]
MTGTPAAAPDSGPNDEAADHDEAGHDEAAGHTAATETDGTGGAGTEAEGITAGEWRAVEHGLLLLRRLVLLCTLLPLTVAVALALGLTAGPAWALFALIPLASALWGWGALARNWRSWRYAERADDLLVARGVLWREMTVVPYGRMQLVEVTSGPLERKYGLARLQLHTAAATTDATIPGLTPGEAERLRDRLTELGEARSAGL